MLHSFQYYAYCYALLLCFLQQQQQHLQVASLAIIIDGASTNEWVTRDEYQRLVDANGSQEGNQQAASESAASTAQQMLSPNQQRQVTDEQSQVANNKQQQEQQLQVHVPAAALETPILELLQERQAQGEALKAAEQLESALERLDLIERQWAPGRNRLSINRQQQQQRQQQQPEQERHQSSRARGRLATSSAQLNSRTLNDLVPVGDRSQSGEALRNLKERGSNPQRYCGKMLVEMLEMVCNGRFWDGALTVEPTVKSKRFKRGVTAECCQRPCHLDDMKPYCATT